MFKSKESCCQLRYHRQQEEIKKAYKLIEALIQENALLREVLEDSDIDVPLR